jgi:hypothetical protein
MKKLLALSSSAAVEEKPNGCLHQAEQREDMAKAMDEFKVEFLKSFSKTKSGEVIKKFPPPSPRNIVIHEDPGKLTEMINEALHHALVNQSDVITNAMHNAIVQALRT